MLQITMLVAAQLQRSPAASTQQRLLERAGEWFVDEAEINRVTIVPVAVVGETGHRREDRQRMILEGWRDALWAGRYAAVRYDCASASAATLIARLATKAGLSSSDLHVAVQADADEIAALVPAADDAEAGEPPSSIGSPDTDGPQPGELSRTDPDPGPLAAAPVRVAPTEAPAPEPETPEEAAERERRYREIFGIPEPKPRRPWRR